jgi:hypothetical protein
MQLKGPKPVVTLEPLQFLNLLNHPTDVELDLTQNIGIPIGPRSMLSLLQELIGQDVKADERLILILSVFKQLLHGKFVPDEIASFRHLG